MLMPEKELSVQVTEIDGVKVDDMDFTKTREDEVLQEFAADAASADEEDASLEQVVSDRIMKFLYHLIPL